MPIAIKIKLYFSNPLLSPTKVPAPPTAIIKAGNQQQLVAIIKATELPIMDFL